MIKAGRPKKKSKRYQMKHELLERVREGDYLTIQGIIEEYYEPKSPYAQLVAVKSVKALLYGIKKALTKEGIPFGSVNESGEWGIPQLKEEYEHMGIRRYKLVKGIIFGSQVIVNSGIQKGLIKARNKTQSMLVPQLDRKKKDDKESSDK